jgi:putative zinc finger protein
VSECLKKEILMAFADCELPSREMESAELHITGCADCKQELESIRATSLKVNMFLSSLAPIDSPDAAPISFVTIPYSGAHAWMRRTAVASVGVLAAALILFVMIRRQDSAPEPNVVKAVAPAPMPSVEKKEVLAAEVRKPAHVATSKTAAKVRQFQALDDGEPIETGMIYRVSLPASTSSSASVSQSAKRIPAEVIVDEFGKVRAIRFLQ